MALRYLDADDRVDKCDFTGQDLTRVDLSNSDLRGCIL